MQTRTKPVSRHVFDPEAITTMHTALEAACSVLRCNDSDLVSKPQSHATRLMLAQRILARACLGDVNYGRLLMVALDGLLPVGTAVPAERPQT